MERRGNGGSFSSLINYRTSRGPGSRQDRARDTGGGGGGGGDGGVQQSRAEETGPAERLPSTPHPPSEAQRQQERAPAAACQDVTGDPGGAVDGSKAVWLMTAAREKNVGLNKKKN